MIAGLPVEVSTFASVRVANGLMLQAHWQTNQGIENFCVNPVVGGNAACGYYAQLIEHETPATIWQRAVNLLEARGEKL